MPPRKKPKAAAEPVGAATGLCKLYFLPEWVVDWTMDLEAKEAQGDEGLGRGTPPSVERVVDRAMAQAASMLGDMHEAMCRSMVSRWHLALLARPAADRGPQDQDPATGQGRDARRLLRGLRGEDAPIPGQDAPIPHTGAFWASAFGGTDMVRADLVE